MNRKIDKIEKYLKLQCKKYGGSFIESNLSSYYNVNGRIIRISDHIGSNSSGYVSIIIPGYRNKDDQYIIHAHTTGAISIVSYEELKTIIHSFFYMSSIFYAVLQPNFQCEIEKIDKFNASDKINEMSKEIERLKNIEKKYKKLKENLNNEDKPVEQLTEQPKQISADSSDLILGIPRTYFEKNQIMPIAAITSKVAKRFGFDSAHIERLKK